MLKNKELYICDGLNEKCPDSCYVKKPHEYDNILDPETRCGNPESEKQFELIKGVVYNA